MQVRTKIRQAKIQAYQSPFLLKTTKTQLQQSVYGAYINMQQALQRLHALEQQYADFENAFHAATVKFEAGIGT
ncbi:MAG: hypothetical protein EKK39_08365 [Sphingobacteriales bacterium]|uniref:TolC family protein n=1 Tax=Hydrotalea flava TaxID=714549 RepID=UPI00082DA72B|nr:TolC family protein [Hydrotalea flava]RTL51226.1 MAG: hypothetical protein EKK39_08365 [Sphingobacteriales bacterium]